MTGPDVSRWNNNALEWLIFILRAASVLLAGAFAVQLILLAAFVDLGYLWPALVELAFAVATGWWGWYVWGNEEWGRRAGPAK